MLSCLLKFQVKENISTTIAVNGINTDLFMITPNKPDIQEFSLVNNESFFKAVIDQSANSILVTDTKGYILYANDRFLKLSKYSEKELLGSHTRINKSGEQPPDFYKNMWSQILEGKVFRGQFKNRAKDGSFYWVNTTITPLKDSMGIIKYFLSVSENITYQKILDERFASSIEFYKLLLNPDYALAIRGILRG